jgi:hypothetical protein
MAFADIAARNPGAAFNIVGSVVTGPTYYVRADGTAATKEDATSDAAAATSMNVTVHNAETFTGPCSIIISDSGGVYRERISPPSSGSAGSPITYLGSGSPVIKGSTDISSASYAWTASGVGTNCYYCRTAALGDPSLDDPSTDLVFLDDVSCAEGASVAGLTDHQYFYGDADSLGYNTIYIRDDSGDPDTTGVLIEASQRGCFYVYQKSYLTVDGLEARHGTGTGYVGGFRVTGGVDCHHIIFQNCAAHWNNGHGINVSGNYGTIDNCVASYNGAHSISATGAEATHGVGFTISNCVTHHARVTGYLGEAPFDGYGIKLLYVDDSFIYGNATYSNEFQGIDLDIGCAGNQIYENHVYDNTNLGLLIELGSHSNEIFRNLFHDNAQSGTWGGEILISGSSYGCKVHHNVIYKTVNTTGTDILLQIWDTGGVACHDTLIYNNIFDGGGVSNQCINFQTTLGTQNSKIKNNIIVGSATTCITLTATDYTGFECDYNCYLRSDANPDVIKRDTVFYTIAEACSAFSMDCNSTVADPLFVAPATGDFRLQSTSPCLGSGVDLGDTYKWALNPNSVWPAAVNVVDQDLQVGWNIGAYGDEDLGVLGGSIAATSTLTGDMSVDRALAGAIAAQSTLTGDMTVSSGSGDSARHSRWLLLLSRHHGWR